MQPSQPAVNPSDLTGRVALVTGGAVGIGRATVLALARAGCDVGVHYHSSAGAAEETAAEVRRLGRAAHLLPADLTVEDEAKAVVDRLVREAGRLDIDPFPFVFR